MRKMVIFEPEEELLQIIDEKVRLSSKYSNRSQFIIDSILKNLNIEDVRREDK
jgi:hypothetical protein